MNASEREWRGGRWRHRRPVELCDVDVILFVLCAVSMCWFVGYTHTHTYIFTRKQNTFCYCVRGNWRIERKATATATTPMPMPMMLSTIYSGGGTRPAIEQHNIQFAFYEPNAQCRVAMREAVLCCWWESLLYSVCKHFLHQHQPRGGSRNLIVCPFSDGEIELDSVAFCAWISARSLALCASSFDGCSILVSYLAIIVIMCRICRCQWIGDGEWFRICARVCLSDCCWRRSSHANTCTHSGQCYLRFILRTRFFSRTQSPLSHSVFLLRALVSLHSLSPHAMKYVVHEAN